MWIFVEYSALKNKMSYKLINILNLLILSYIKYIKDTAKQFKANEMISYMGKEKSISYS